MQRELSRDRVLASVQFKLSSICALFSTTTRPLFFFSTALSSQCPISYPRGVVGTPSSSSGLKLVKNSTVGLVKLEDFQLKRKELEEAKAREAARTDVLK